MGGGVIYLVLWLYGLLVDLDSSANFVPVNTADNWLHFLLGVGMIGFGLALSRGVAPREHIVDSRVWASIGGWEPLAPPADPVRPFSVACAGEAKYPRLRLVGSIVRSLQEVACLSPRPIPCAGRRSQSSASPTSWSSSTCRSWI